MKRLAAVLLAVFSLTLAVCGFTEIGGLAETPNGVLYEKRSVTFFGAFDTVITFTAYTESQECFDRYAAYVKAEFLRLHTIFDQYHAYEGVQNLWLLNQSASDAPVPAEPELIRLLKQVRIWREQYGNQLNPALGSVLTLWHDAREEGVSTPGLDALQSAALHSDYAQVVIDEAALTVYYADPDMMLDLGAVAKGYAAQLVCDGLYQLGAASFLINAGGNVVCGAPPLDGRTAWTIAIEDADGVSTRVKTYIAQRSVVTSGDYQRYYTVNGQRYHHLIDPNTLFPASYMRAVSVVCEDSGLADFLSTTAFLLPYEQSRTLIESVQGAEALWILPDNSLEMTDGFVSLTMKP